MSKYLFTDGTNGVKEVQSPEELEALVASSANPEAIKVWIFNTNEWISYAAFRKIAPVITRKEKTLVSTNQQLGVGSKKLRARSLELGARSQWLKKILYIPVAAAGVFLIFNFTRIKWEKADPLYAAAVRPENVPVMDIDSLIYEIETARGTSLDRSTRTNLRLRNDWPELIGLTLHAEKETSNAGSRYFNLQVSIDNTTGFNLDNAVVKLSVWKNEKVNSTDTIRFNAIRYDKVLTRLLDATYRADSITVSFESIRAKAFNFCYSATTKNNSGNYNDRWFCRE
ncbi:MAG: hypothetical protein ABIT05_02765 [Chitinophagaceae bacterium]